MSEPDNAAQATVLIVDDESAIRESLQNGPRVRGLRRSSKRPAETRGCNR